MQELDQTQELIQMLKERLNEKDETIATLQATIETLQITIANLTETLDEFKRKFFGISSEKSKKKQTDEPVCEEASEQESGIPVKEHTRTRKKKAKRDDLYALLPIEEVLCDVPQEERLCPDCGAEMEHMGYTFIREELRITPAKVVRVRYMQEKLICPICREEDDTTITQAKTPTALMRIVRHHRIWSLWLCTRKAFCICLSTDRKRTGKKKEFHFRERPPLTGITPVLWNTCYRFIRRCMWS